MRGNVVDLAVAVVIGAAFTNIVNSVVKGVINPLVGAFGTKNLDNYSSCLKEPCEVHRRHADGIQIMWGSVLGATLTFVITAAVVYFLMVLPMAKYLARQEARQKAKEGAQEVIEVTELEVLKEIRDALVAQRGSGTPSVATRSSGWPAQGGGLRLVGSDVVGRLLVEEARQVGRAVAARGGPLAPPAVRVVRRTAGPADRRRPARACGVPGGPGPRPRKAQAAGSGTGVLLIRSGYGPGGDTGCHDS